MDGKRGKNKRLRFSVHFDAKSEEFNQLLQIDLLNIAGQGYFNPPPPPIRPPLQPHPNITNILVHMCLCSLIFQSMMVGMK
jgi:hypothetical protein